MTSRYNPRISRPGGAGGGPPVSVDDHFTAKIIVGNVPNGDPAVAQAFPFRYIPDPGDGSGIALALTEAAVAGQGGDIFLRAGIYDFGLGGSPALPLTVPANVQLRGGGGGVPATFGGVPSRGATLVISATNRALFLMEPISGLDNLSIEIGAPAVGAVGTEVVTANPGGVNFVNRCTFFVTADQADAVNESLTAIVRGEFIGMTESIMGNLMGTYQPSQFALPDLVGISAREVNVAGSQIAGLDLGYEVQPNGSATAVNIALINNRVGASVLAPGGNLRVSDAFILATEKALVMEGAQVVVVNTLASDPAPGTGTIGIEQNGGSLQIGNTTIVNYERGVLNTAGLLQLRGLNIFGAPATPGIPAVEINTSDCILSDLNIAGFDVGVEMADGGSCKVHSVEVNTGSLGFVVRDGVRETQIDNCRADGFGAGGTGLLVEPGADDTTVRGLHVRDYATGVDYGADFFTLLGCNLRTLATPIAVTGAPPSAEVAHNQL